MRSGFRNCGPGSESFFRPEDGKEDLGPHAYTIRNSSYSFHERVHGDLSVSIRLAFPYECGSAYGGRQQQIDTLLIYICQTGRLVKDSNLLNPLYLVLPACGRTRFTLPIGLWSTESSANFLVQSESGAAALLARFWPILVRVGVRVRVRVRALGSAGGFRPLRSLTGK